MRVINLTPATSSQQQRTLDEVKDFALTDMDRGGQERWTYRMLQEPALSEQLEKLAGPRSLASGTVDTVHFQPCRTWHHRSQDRYVVEEWALPGGTWTYAAVFDGHMNHDTADHVSAVVGPSLKKQLDAAIRARPAETALPSLVGDVMRRTLQEVDAALIADFLALLPRDADAVGRLEPARAKAILNDKSSANGGHGRTARAFGGTTALVALVDPGRRQLWVANVGDCVAAVAERPAAAAGGRWRGSVVNAIHNGSNAKELARVRAEHPEEADCAWNGRVLGFLAPTRALGDAWLKLPAAHAALVFHHYDADWLAADSMGPHLARIRTPPYLSAAPDVYHRVLPPGSRRALVLASDGLTDLYDGYAHQDMADEWAEAVGRALDASSPNGSPNGGGGGGGGKRTTQRPNAALALLREAIGGDDTQLVSRNLTVEMEERWMDDTTIVVLRL